MSIISLQIQLFLLIAIGYLLSWKGMLIPKTRKQLTDLIIYVVLPCNIVHSFMIKFSHEILLLSGEVLIIGFVIQGFYILLNKFLWNRFPPNQGISLKYGIICSNAGFMGLPLSESVFGSIGLLYASVALLPIRIFMWSSGLSLFTTTTKKQVVKTLATHPCIIAVFVGLVIMIFQIPIPAFLDSTITSLSSCCTALSMIVIGSILADVDLRTVFEKATVLYSFVRLIAIPAVIYVVLRLIGIDNLVTGVIVLLAAMPAGSTTAMLAQKYDQDAPFASKLVFTSTLTSLITLPFWAFLLT